MDLALQRELDLAGMSTKARISDLTRAAILVPGRAKISNGDLVYDPRNCERKPLRGADRLLESFTALWRKDDEAAFGEGLLRFVSRYGVLELDEATGYCPAQDRKVHAALWSKGEFPKIGREPLARWRSYSRRFSALLAISAKLHQGKPGDPEEWRALEPKCRSGTFDVGTGKFLVAQTIGEFVLQSNLHPVLEWPCETGPTIVFGLEDTAGLFAALLFQLMLAIARVDGLSICGSCQRSFRTAKKARRGNTRFCDICRKDGSAHRVAVRNCSNRKKQLLREGEHEQKTR